MKRERGRPEQSAGTASTASTAGEHTWPRTGIPAEQSYAETTSILDGAPVRIAVPDDPEGEAAALDEALNDPEIAAHIGSREALAAAGPPVAEAQVYSELGLEARGRRYSGNVRVRLPKGLHQTLAVQAAEQGVSLNTLIVSYLARQVGQVVGGAAA